MRVTSSFNISEHVDEKIIIYGAGNYGAIAKLAIETLGGEIEAFADRSLAGMQYEGVRCIHPNELSEYANDNIIIASLNYFYDMIAFCESIGAEHVFDMEQLMYVKVDESKLTEYARDELHNPEKYHNVIEAFSEEQVVVNHVELVITERCTLKCKDCANLMQYYKTPENMQLDELITQFDSFLDTIDLLLDLRILGGEPFIVRDIGNLIDYYSTNEKIKRITIYTNSTIVPQDDVLDMLQSEKVAVHMSNYGKISGRVNELDSALKQKGIQHYIHKYEKWNNLGGCSRRKITLRDAEKMFSECLMAHCLTFYRGKLYLCPRAAHGEQLGFFANTCDDFVDFTEKTHSKSKKREELCRFLKESRCTTACFYCNGSNARSKEVDAAKQITV